MIPIRMRCLRPLAARSGTAGPRTDPPGYLPEAASRRDLQPGLRRVGTAIMRVLYVGGSGYVDAVLGLDGQIAADALANLNAPTKALACLRTAHRAWGARWASGADVRLVFRWAGRPASGAPRRPTSPRELVGRRGIRPSHSRGTGCR